MRTERGHLADVIGMFRVLAVAVALTAVMAVPVTLTSAVAVSVSVVMAVTVTLSFLGSNWLAGCYQALLVGRHLVQSLGAVLGQLDQ